MRRGECKTTSIEATAYVKAQVSLRVTKAKNSRDLSVGRCNSQAYNKHILCANSFIQIRSTDRFTEFKVRAYLFY